MLFVALALGGCMSVNATAPENIGVGGSEVYSAAPPASIPVADPNSLQDLQRENQQLKDRAAWLDGHIQKLRNKSNDMSRKIDEALAKLRKLSDQRDRFKRAAGGA
jgi:peptidoglycan hydrolase CwlO-like protein